MHEKYAGKSAINIFSGFNNWINTRYDQRTEMDDHVLQLESQFARLAFMDYIVEESMHVVILLSPLIVCVGYAPIMASVNTVDEEVPTCNYVPRNFIEESKSLKSSLTTTETRPRAVSGQLAPMASKHNRIQRKVGVAQCS